MGLAQDEIIRLKSENIRLKKLRDGHNEAAEGKSIDCIEKDSITLD